MSLGKCLCGEVEVKISGVLAISFIVTVLYVEKTVEQRMQLMALSKLLNLR